MYKEIFKESDFKNVDPYPITSYPRPQIHHPENNSRELKSG